jgi:cell division protein ZapD
MDHQIQDPTELGTRNVIASIINLLQLLDRPDLKAKLAKELSHQTSLLVRLQNTPEIDHEKLNILLKQLEDLARRFIDSSKKIGQNLRDVELLNNLRLHLASPGGGCSFDIPLYHYWLNQPAPERQNGLMNLIIFVRPLH